LRESAASAATKRSAPDVIGIQSVAGAATSASALRRLDAPAFAPIVAQRAARPFAIPSKRRLETGAPAASGRTLRMRKFAPSRPTGGDEKSQPPTTRPDPGELTMRLSVLLAAAVLAGAVATTASAKVVVSSKIDTEGGVLGNVVALALKTNGIEVEDRIQLGGTPVVRKAIMAGEIDIYPEYTGNAAYFFNKADDPVWKDAAKGYEEAKKLDYDANKIVWLTPSPANNTWAIALRKEVVASAMLETLSDFGKWVSGGGKVKLAASAEFVNSPAALPAFQTAYGFKLSPEQLIVLSGGDTAATIKAAAEQTNGANAAMVYGTDGAIQPSGLVVLDDDKGVQPVYRPTPIIREAALKANPKIADILKPIFEALDLATLQELNARVQVEGEPAKAVAEDFLKSKGFLK
jgi:osmoprotectant transport system substrate-binding protein